MLGLCIILALYQNVILAYSMLYVFASLQDPLPWMSCNNFWNTNSCVPITELKDTSHTYQYQALPVYSSSSDPGSSSSSSFPSDPHFSSHFNRTLGAYHFFLSAFSTFLTDEQVVEGEEEAVARGVEAGPGAAPLVAGPPRGQVGRLAHPSGLL